MTVTWEYIWDALRRHRKSMVKYVLVGGSTFVLDFVLLVLLHELVHLPVVVAATISYWTSIGYNFWLNRHWTFTASATRSLRHHAVAYGALLLTNYLVTVGIIWGLGHLGIPYPIAKILAVGFSTSWTYVIYKKVIFV